MAPVTNQHPTPNAPELPDDAPEHVQDDSQGGNEGVNLRPAENKLELTPKEESGEPTKYVDTKRDAINARARELRKSQTVEFHGDQNDPNVLYGAEANRDELGDLERQALNRQREVNGQQPLPNPEDAPEYVAEDTQQPAAPQRTLNGLSPDLLGQKVVVIVNGQREEITVEESIRRAQINSATESTLREAKDILTQTRELRQQLNQPATVTTEEEDGYDDQGDKRNTSDVDQRATDLANAIQFGSPEEAAEAIKQVLERNAQSDAPKANLRDEVVNVLEAQKSEAALRAYADKYPTVKDPVFQEAIAKFTPGEMIKDLEKVGITADQLRGKINSDQQLTEFHKLVRANGHPVRSAVQLLHAAHKAATVWRTGKPLVEVGRAPNPVPVPPINRQQRKEALQPQPENRRQIPATTTQKPRTQDQSRADAVAKMRASRHQAV